MAFAIVKPLLNETTRGKFIFGSTYCAPVVLPTGRGARSATFLPSVSIGRAATVACDKDENLKLLKEYIDERWIPARYRGPIADGRARLWLWAKEKLGHALMLSQLCCRASWNCLGNPLAGGVERRREKGTDGGPMVARQGGVFFFGFLFFPFLSVAPLALSFARS